MSATAIKNRVDDLIANGVITEFTVDFSPEMAGSEYMMIFLETGTTEDRAQFILEIAENRGVRQIVPLYGGNYYIIAEYASSVEMANLIEAIKSHPDVNSTEMHPLTVLRGKKTTLTNLQLRVLRSLLEDARMPISDIARETGLTVRLVRRTLRELEESEAIGFSLRWRLNVSDRVAFLLKLKWDPKRLSRNEIFDLLLKNYEDEIWDILLSASEPLLIGIIIVDNLNQVDKMTTEIRSYNAVLYSEAIMYRPPYNCKSIRRLALEEAVQQAESRLS